MSVHDEQFVTGVFSEKKSTTKKKKSKNDQKKHLKEFREHLILLVLKLIKIQMLTNNELGNI